jgi:hypothetical protein
MNIAEAIGEATKRARRTKTNIEVYFNADHPALDYRNRYIACRHLQRPAHGRHVCTVKPSGLVFTPGQDD